MKFIILSKRKAWAGRLVNSVQDESELTYSGTFESVASCLESTSKVKPELIIINNHLFHQTATELLVELKLKCTRVKMILIGDQIRKNVMARAWRLKMDSIVSTAFWDRHSYSIVCRLAYNNPFISDDLLVDLLKGTRVEKLKKEIMMQSQIRNKQRCSGSYQKEKRDSGFLTALSAGI
jgi:hypothetical protein